MNRMRVAANSLKAAVLAGMALVGQAWGDTLTWVGPYQYATGLYSNQWSVAENWLNESGQHAVPKTGDSLVLASDCTVGGQYPSNDLKTYPALRKLTLQGTKQTIGGTTVCLQAGNEGIVQECGMNAYFAVSFPAGETPFTIAAGKGFCSSEKCAYANGSVIVKKGDGELGINLKSTPKTVRVQEGAFGIKAAGTATEMKVIYDGATSDFFVYNVSAVLKDFDFEETANASASTHTLRVQQYNTTTTMSFTGTPKKNPMVFTGMLTQNGIWEWAPDSSESEWVFAKAASSFNGTIKVTNGKVSVKDGAQLASVSALAVASGATLNIEEKCYIRAKAATIGDMTLQAGKMYRGSDGAVPGLTGEGYLVVAAAAKTGTDSEATWVGGVDSNLATDGNWEGGSAPDLTAGGTRVIIKPNAGVDVSNLTFDGDLFLRGLDIQTDADITIKATSLTFSHASVSNVVTVGRADSRQQVTLDVASLVVSGSTSWRLGDGANVHVKGTINNAGYSMSAFGKGMIHCYKDMVGSWFVSREKAGFLLHGVTLLGGFNLGADSTGNILAAEKGTTNVVTGIFGYNTGYSEWCANNSTAEGGTCGGLIVVEGGSLLHANMQTHNYRFDKKPIINSMRMMLPSEKFGDLSLNAPSNIIGCASSMISGGNTMRAMCPYALVDWRITRNNKECKPIIEFTGQGAVDLGGYDQSLAIIWADREQNGVVSSATPAQLRWNFDISPYTISGYANLWAVITNSVTFTGGAGLTFAGADSEPFTSTRLTAQSTTTGTLEVVSGRLTLAAKGSWANAAAVKVSGGTLVVESANGIGAATALTVSDAGTVDLAFSSRLHVGSLNVGGVTLPDGLYGGPDSSAPVMPQINGRYAFAGTGRVQVGKVGMVLLFK